MNPVRAKRPRPETERVVDASCQWCQVRASVTPTLAAMAPYSYVIWSDVHDPLRIDEDRFVAMFDDAAETLAREAGARRFEMYLVNGGPDSGASVAHAHAQALARQDRHFEYAERAAMRGASFLTETEHLHRSKLGLALPSDIAGATGWLNIVPVKENDTTVISRTLSGGARLVHRVLRVFVGLGLRSYSLAVIKRPAPEMDVPGFDGFPNYLWRLLDRSQRIATMELFGTAVCSHDPFVVHEQIVRKLARHAT